MDQTRKTSRTTAGVPPERLGWVPNAASSGQSGDILNLSGGGRTPNHRSSSSKSVSGRSTKSQSSTRTSRSYSSTVQQLEIDVQTEEEINQLEEQHDQNERLIQTLELEVKNLTDQVEVSSAKLLTVPVENKEERYNLEMKIWEEQANLSEKRKLVEKQRLDLKYQEKTLTRKKSQLRRAANLRKQILMEQGNESDDNLSQKLSDNEGEEDDVETEDVLAAEARASAERQARQRNVLETESQQRSDADQPTALEDDDLLVRLRRLQDPIVPEIPRNVITSNAATRPFNTNSANTSTDQLYQVLAQTFEKLSNSSSSTDKFLARQVQGKDLPLFYGNPEEWSMFITAFENTTTGCGFSHQDNLPRLQKCLKGEAANTVKCLLSRPENVPAIIAKLKMRFGRPEHIVQLLINKATDVPTFKEDRLDLLIDFGLAVDNLVETIKALKCDDHLTSPQLLAEFTKKLPVSYRTKWMEWVAADTTRKETLQFFAQWMQKQTEVACKLCPPSWKENNPPRRDHGNPRKKVEKVWATAEESKHSSEAKFNNKDMKCLFCEVKGHRVLQCRKFEREVLDNKWKWVKDNRHCFCCLKPGHSVKDCRSKKECSKDGCTRYHHLLLHQQQPPATAAAAAEVPVANTTEAIHHAVNSNRNVTSSHTNLMILPVVLKGPKGTLSTFAFLDPGATVTVIQEEIANQLGLEGELQPFSHSGLHPTITEENSRSVSLQIQSMTDRRLFNLKKVRTISKMSLPCQSVKTSLLRKWKHLHGLGIQSYEQGQPTILIGQDHVQLCNTRELKLGPPNAPAAGRTELGWVLVGRMEGGNRTELTFMVHERIDDELHQLVKKHFTTEDFGVKVTHQSQRSNEDIRAQQLMDSTIKKNENSWEIGLLWKSDDVILPNTKSLAMSRLTQMERRMDRDSSFGAHYIAKINEYQQKGFARLLTEDEAKNEGPRTFYLPHFMNKNPKKPTKLRFVFDAAARVNGFSLNDALLKGPDKLTSLPTVLFKFRQRAIGITADIKDMFHRVKVRSEDACSQRFLFRGLDRNRNPDVYEMGVLIFGAACSPACAQEVKNVNSKLFEEEYPECSAAIVNNHYVDDYLDSLDSSDEAIQRYHELRKIHLSGGFDICNWISSSRAVHAVIPEELHAPGVKNMDFDGDAERVLGLFWRPDTDNFTFSRTFLKVNEEILNRKRLPTKRELLSLTMSIYDPMGFLALFTIKARIILQETWRTGIGWDDEIPLELQDKWERWNNELQNIEQFKLPRCYSPDFSKADSTQLHVFCDASQQAFGAVAYIRIQKGDLITVSLVGGKAKVAPTKHLTIPRLELQAAVLGSRWESFIKSGHDVKIHQTIYWSDSSTVLSWIRTDGNKFKQFVANRIGEIQEDSQVSEWRWIPTKENVADELTRDSQPSDWSGESRWVNGPAFLKLPEDQWPQEKVQLQPEISEELEVKKDYVCALMEKQTLIDINRFSSWKSAVKTMGYVFRFLKNTRLSKYERPTIRELDPSEMNVAERWWWKSCQSESFDEEIRCLTDNKSLPRTSRLLKLNVVMDIHGVIRLDGRINNADVPQHTKQPVVLDPKHRFTELMILYYHQQGGHHGQEKIVNELRQQYHIINLRSAVKKSWNDCQMCKNERALPVVPQMGQLPPFRVESHVSPFQNSGLDYFGPMTVTVGRRNEKRWGALFTCLSTRAVHVELASSLSTDSCLMAIRRFVARRGCPTNLHSDNGTNFTGANNELKKSLQELNQEQITAACTSKGIQWHFIPPLAPHMGGSWERMVKSIKVALKAVLKDIKPKDEVLQTLMTEAEHVVNSHPLTHVSVDPDDPEALTPNHFLLGRSSNGQPPGRFDEGDLCSRKQWRQAQQLANHFWKRWIREYLPTLLRRRKWFQQQEAIEVGDVVLVVDNQLVRNSWPMGIVTKLYPGNDGLTRVVDVKTQTGTYRRPVAKLCKLDVRRDDSKPMPGGLIR